MGSPSDLFSRIIMSGASTGEAMPAQPPEATHVKEEVKAAEAQPASAQTNAAAATQTEANGGPKTEKVGPVANPAAQTVGVTGVSDALWAKAQQEEAKTTTANAAARRTTREGAGAATRIGQHIDAIAGVFDPVLQAVDDITGIVDSIVSDENVARVAKVIETYRRVKTTYARISDIIRNE